MVTSIKPAQTQCGVTLIELVLVVILLGILSAVIAPNLTRSGVEGRDFFDRTLNSIRFAQKLAVAQRREVWVCLGANSVAVGFASGCTSALASDPGGGTIDFNSAAVSISGSGFSFDNQGQVSAQHDITISVPSTGDAYALRVENNTGYVHPQP